jgi:CubicO group peptidase (beta-lactamase class C family)
MHCMRNVVTALVISAVALSGASCSAIGQQLEQRVAGQAATQIPSDLDVHVLDFLDTQKVPGATVAVTRNGRLVLSKGYGLADIDSGLQMQPSHRTKIGSVSKVITTIGALQLAEQGQLDLDGHLYASEVNPVWWDPAASPFLQFSDDGILAGTGDYLYALVTAIDNLSSPDLNELLDPNSDAPSYVHHGSYQDRVDLVLDWASQMQVRHLLSHTSGLLRSGDSPKTAAVFDKEPEEITYPELHRAMLMGVNGPPLLFPAGTARDYSNHGFGLMGQIIAEVSDMPYVNYTHANILAPLGLHDVVPTNLSVNELDATPYVSDKKGNPKPPQQQFQTLLDQPTISTSTGGWVATGQDLARIMCGLDQVSNNQRLLAHDTVDTMSTVWFPSAQWDQPLGWDWRRNVGELSKTGSTRRGGSARITKFLPGEFGNVEINVAVATNKRGGTPPRELLRTIAKLAAEADIPDEYDLFHGNPCRVDPGMTVQPPGSTPTPTGKPTPTDLPTPTTKPTPPTPVGTPPTQPPPTPTRTTPPPTRIAAPTVRAEDIWTLYRAMHCGPTETEVRASVYPGSTLVSVDLHWRVAEHTGSEPMTQVGAEIWSATLGPFSLDVLPEQQPSAPLILTVLATDQVGETASPEVEITLHRCPPLPQ